MSDDSHDPPAADEPSFDLTQEPGPSPAMVRFKACRWHAKDDELEYCSNRDVLPYAGKQGFAAEAWCPDCALYKLRRTPKKRPHPEDIDDEC
jgi:hypothetical protein